MVFFDFAFSRHKALAQPQVSDETTIKKNFNPIALANEVENASYTNNTKSVNLSLEDCIKLALKNNPLISKYIFDIKSQNSLFLASKTKWYPTISIEGQPFISQQYSTAKSNLNADSIVRQKSSSSSNVSETSYNVYDVFTLDQYIDIEATLTWKILDFTRTPAIKSNWESIKKQQNLLKLAARKLIADVSISYVKVQASQKKIEELKPLISATIASEKAISKQLDIGYSDIGQVAQSQTQVLNLINDLILFKKMRDEYSADLTSLVGGYGEFMIYPSTQISEPTPFYFDLSDAINLSETNNELSRAYIHAANSLMWDSVALRNQYIPKLFLYLNWYYENYDGIINAPSSSNPSIMSNSFRQVDTGYTTGIGFSWNFDGGYKWFRSDSEKFSSSSMKEQAKSAKIDFISKTRQNYIALNSAFQSISTTKKAVDSSSINLKVLDIRSQYGLDDVTTKVQAFNLYNESLQNWVDALKSANIAKINLFRYTSTLPSWIDLDRLLFK